MTYIYYFLDDKIWLTYESPTVQQISCTDPGFPLQEVVRTLCQVAPDAGRPPPEVWRCLPVAACVAWFDAEN